MVKNVNSRIVLSGFESQPWFLLAVWLQISHLTSQNFCFHICKVRKIIHTWLLWASNEKIFVKHFSMMSGTFVKHFSMMLAHSSIKGNDDNRWLTTGWWTVGKNPSSNFPPKAGMRKKATRCYSLLFTLSSLLSTSQEQNTRLEVRTLDF